MLIIFSRGFLSVATIESLRKLSPVSCYEFNTQLMKTQNKTGTYQRKDNIFREFALSERRKNVEYVSILSLTPIIVPKNNEKESVDLRLPSSKKIKIESWSACFRCFVNDS